ncbi:MAG: phospholipase D-like domain-containing protein [Candidatus Margulisbacteria bacterium]|nr:phospholipase D-like domain-containing protein [Candidatus Margulisiibacteriota bacterium]
MKILKYYLISVLFLFCFSNQVFFSPHGNIRQELVRLIGKSTGNIDLAIYSFTSKELALSLLSAKQSGRKVRIIADRSQQNGTGSVIGWLTKYIEVRILPAHQERCLMHDKFMVIGDKYLTTGSYNWTSNAELFNYENLIILTDKETIQQFSNEFNKLWQLARPMP